MSNIDHNVEYSHLLKNKTVAIVGPSSSVKVKGNGEKIESCDLIIRINQGIDHAKNNSEYVGHRTDVLYNSLDFDPHSGGNILKFNMEGVKTICSPYPKNMNCHNSIIYYSTKGTSLYEKYKIRFIDEDIYSQAKENTNSRINSGLGAIIDILTFDIKNLYVTGIDFYRSFYCKDYCVHRNRVSEVKELEKELEFKIYNDSSHHNPDRQYSFFKKKIVEDKRIEIDSFMKKIINDKRYDVWDTIPRD